ncbi:MAG: ELWxxDGT repeat protein [Bacteroidota bacterium]
MKKLFLLSFLLSTALFSTAQHPFLVKDIFPGDSAIGSLDGFSPQTGQTGDYLYFSAGDPSTTGTELWRTDGTPGGTEMIMDIIPGFSSSQPHYFASLNDILYYTIWDGIQAFLWRSDGTQEGTYYKSLCSADGNNTLRIAFGMSFLFNNKILFRGYDEAHGLELWVNDGTDEGTHLLKDLNPGTGHSFPNHYTLLGDKLIFVANDGTGGKIWKSDGTPEGTVIIKDVAVGMDGFLNVDSILYFEGDDDINGRELWRTDGTTEGTFLVKDIYPGSKDSHPSYLKELNGLVYFAATEFYNNELWKSDGTVEGTKQVKDIFPGPKGSNPGFLENLNDQFLLFAADDSIHGKELWITDGTTGGTTLLKDIAPGSAGSVPYHMKAFGDRIYFKARNADYGNELWKTDGTEAGTMLVKDICPGEGYGFEIAFSYNEFTAFNGKMFFAASNGSSGAEPWISDGTAEGTFMLRDIATNQKHGNPERLADMNGSLYFSAVDSTDEEYGYRSLYNTDGSNSGTINLMKLFGSGDVKGMAPLGSKVIFSCVFNDLGTEPGVSDGTPEGTHLLKDVDPGPESGASYTVVPYSDKVFFLNNYSFWETDGTEEGTKMVMDTIRITEIFPALGQLFLNASRQRYYDAELWKSNGTKEGTQLVKNINTVLNRGSGIDNFVEFQDKVFFTAFDSTNNQQLWHTDGTEAGTQKVAEIGSYRDDARYFYPEVAGEYLFLSVDDGVHGRELWKTDGTTNGTAMVKDIISDEAGSEPDGLVNLNGKLIFLASTPETGKELWISDGSSEGTHIIKDIAPGRFDGVYVISGYKLTRAGNYVYFAGNDGISDFELWRTDGTESGTVRVSDIFPGAEGSLPLHFQASGNKLYFTANHPDYGRELWALDITTGTDKPKLRPALLVYPNPTTHLLTIESSNTETIYICDITGRPVRIIHHPASPEILNVSGLSPGIYFIRAGEITAKFLKQ